jgi:acylphosphatase
MTGRDRVVRRLIVRGRVQGIGYRAWVEDEALARGLEGWVRNRRDGTVEAVFAGAPEVVADMVEACRRGPPLARVDAIDAWDGGAADLARGEPGGRFSVLATA